MIDQRGIRHFEIDDGYRRVDTVEREAHWAIETRLNEDHLARCQMALKLERYYLHYEPALSTGERYRRIADQLGISVLKVGDMLTAAREAED